MGRDEEKGVEGCSLSFWLEHAVLVLMVQLPLAIEGVR